MAKVLGHLSELPDIVPRSGSRAFGSALPGVDRTVGNLVRAELRDTQRPRSAGRAECATHTDNDSARRARHEQATEVADWDVWRWPGATVVYGPADLFLLAAVVRSPACTTPVLPRPVQQLPHLHPRVSRWSFY